MMIAFGRYKGSGAGAVKITGTLNGEKHEFANDVSFGEGDTKNGFIPRLWATRRVGYLLDEIRLRGESKELKDEVTRLAREHGIVTPYTAYLILEDEARRGVPVAAQTMRELQRDRAASGVALKRYDSARAEAKDARLRAGESAVTNAQEIEQLKQGVNEQQTQRGQELAKGGAAPAARPTLQPA